MASDFQNYTMGVVGLARVAAFPEVSRLLESRDPLEQGWKAVHCLVSFDAVVLSKRLNMLSNYSRHLYDLRQYSMTELRCRRHKNGMTDIQGSHRCCSVRRWCREMQRCCPVFDPLPLFLPAFLWRHFHNTQTHGDI